MTSLFGASSSFYGETSYSRPVQGAPAMVREFPVRSTTTRSFVLDYGINLPMGPWPRHER